MRVKSVREQTQDIELQNSELQNTIKNQAAKIKRLEQETNELTEARNALVAQDIENKDALFRKSIDKREMLEDLKQSHDNKVQMLEDDLKREKE